MTQPLTADLCARAIVASARAYGDDPLRAVSVTRGVLRRSLSPAAVALSRTTMQERTRICALLNLRDTSVTAAQSKSGEDFQRALAAALLALGGPATAIPPTQSTPAIAGPVEVDRAITVVDPPPKALAPPRMPGPKPLPKPAAAALTPVAPAKRPQTHDERMALIKRLAKKRGMLRARPPARARGAQWGAEAPVADLTKMFR